MIRIQPNKRLERWLMDRAAQIKTLEVERPEESSKLAVQLIQALEEAAEWEAFKADVTLVLVSTTLLGLLVGVESAGVLGRLLAGGQLVLRLTEVRHGERGGRRGRQEEYYRRLGSSWRASNHQRSLPMTRRHGRFVSSSLSLPRSWGW